MEAALGAAGLRLVEQIDLADPNRASAENLARRGEKPAPENAIVMGDDFPQRCRNVATGLANGRIVEHLLLAQED